MIRQPWRWFVRHVLHRAAADDELDTEIRTHLTLETQRRSDAGASPEDARRAAHKDFGNVLLIKDVTRDIWGWGSIERGWRDVRYAWRRLARSPGFTFAVVATLALTIGPTTAILSVGNWLIWRPVPHAVSPE